MILLDLFSGYGGFHLGLARAGFKFEKIYFSEIDKNAIANYKYNFRNENIEYIGAVENVLTSGIERPDIITFGSPCQDFSIGGDVAGLQGYQSSLIKYGFAAISHFRPNVFIWENVKGCFSSNNRRDFWEIIKAFANIGGYRIEWQLLNTAWFLPQNRERIYLVGRLADRCTGEIFPVGKNDEFNQKPIGANKKQFQAQNCSTIKGNFGTRGDETFVIRKNGKLSKLTEIECERLQGLPDDFTKYGDFNGTIKEIAMTKRYGLIGNGISIPVVEDIGKSILKNTNKT